MDYFSPVYPYHRPKLFRYIKSGGSLIMTGHGVYERRDSVKLELHIPRAVMPYNVKIDIGDEAGTPTASYIMPHSDYRLDADIFALTLDMNDIPSSDGSGVGLFYFTFTFDSRVGPQRITQSQRDGLPEISPFERADGAFALTIYERNYPEPDGWYGGIIYHIFVDRFAKSGKCKPKPYAQMNDDWYGGTPQFAEYPGAPVANDMFFGGDLFGVADKLPYLKSLGVTCIYLSPVFDAHSNHKYDTGDFDAVDSMFGGEEALSSLITKAAAAGIKVILDGVFNHTGSDSKYFNMDGNYGSGGAYRSQSSEYYKWFYFTDYPDSYDCWWGVKILPRVNSSDPDYIDYINGSGGVAEKYMKMGIFGWRIDVVDELCDAFVDSFRACVDNNAEKAPVVIGEVWEDASCKIAYGARRRYFTGKQLDSVMNYPVRAALIEYIRFGNEKALYLALFTIWEHYPPEVIHSLMNLLGTHDTERIITALAGELPDGKTNAQLAEARMTREQYDAGIRLEMLAYMINATIPGLPSIYYGDEAGMEGYTDPFNRLPYPWGRENLALRDFYIKCNSVRRKNDVYKKGELELIRHDIDGFFMFGRRRADEDADDICGQIIYTAVNRGELPVFLTISHSDKAKPELLLSVGDIICDAIRDAIPDVISDVISDNTDPSSDAVILIPPLCGAVIRAKIDSLIDIETYTEEEDADV